jgi:hypothetical protein
MGVLSPRPRGRLWGASATALLCLSLGLAASTGPAEADKVGVAAAVNPDAFSSLSGSPQTQLKIGKSIFFNERINTTTNGLVQVLLVDGSTFTVGPGSDLVIDKFVYDAKKGTGQIAASMTKGVMRFVGGKISKNDDAVKVNTPAGALAIRGGMFQMQVNGQKVVASFLYGVALTLANKYTAFQPGYTIDTTSGSATIRPTTSADVNAIMAALTNGNTAGAGTPADAAGGNKPSKYTEVQTLSLQDLVADATATQVNDTLQKDETTETPPPGNTDNPPPPPPPPPPPAQVTLRILNSPGVYTAFPNGSTYTTDSAGQQGILGGGNYAEGTPADKHVDDFIWTFDIVNDRLTGTVSGLFDSSCIPGTDCGQIETHPQPADAIVDFPGTLTCDGLGVCGITEADHATVTQAGQTTTYVGLAVLRKDFVAYQMIGVPQIDLSPSTDGENPPGTGDVNGPSANPLLVFGGKGYDFGTPSGKTYSFTLLPDIKQGVLAPFAGPDSFPAVDLSTDENGNYIKPLPVISDLLYLEKDNGGVNDQSRAVWLQTSLYINTTPADPENDVAFDQQSFVNVALGGVENGGLVGARRGGSSVDVTTFCGGLECGPTTKREAFAFTGDIATLAGPDGSHFLGKDDPNIVIGFDSTGTHNIGRDIPLQTDTNSPSQVQNQSGSTYHIGLGNGAQQPQPQTLDGTLKGYAVGMITSATPPTFVNVVASKSPDDFTITFNKTANSLLASLRVYSDILPGAGDSATDAYNIGFGDDPQAPANKSAYIDNVHYAAIENGSSVTNSNYSSNYQSVPYEFNSATGYLASGEQLGVTNFFPETFTTVNPDGTRPFCDNCDFLQWGAWGGRFGFGDGSSASFTDNVHLGWWVAGDLASAEELNALDQSLDVNAFEALGASATYDGHVIGTVAAKIDNLPWQTYTAAGDLSMTWSFADRSGDLSITNFDHRSYSTEGDGPGLTQPSLEFNKFAGSLHQTDGPSIGDMTGNVTGSFVRPLTDAGIPSGVLGNFGLGSNDYKATGIFAGGLAVPH